MLTGKIPVSKAVGDEVIGASLNKTGSFILKATKIGKDSSFSNHLLVEQHKDQSTNRKTGRQGFRVIVQS